MAAPYLRYICGICAANVSTAKIYVTTTTIEDTNCAHAIFAELIISPNKGFLLRIE
jgi:hypothetical protein